MLNKIGIFEIDADIDKKYNEYILKPVEDQESVRLLASMGIKKMFKGERFYHAPDMANFLGRIAAFNLIATIENRIYKIYFKFLDDDRPTCRAFRDEIREHLSEEMTPQQLSNPQITKIDGGQLSIWHFDWGNFLLEEFGMLTPTGTVWSTSISATSRRVKGAQRTSFMDRLFNRG